MRPGSDSKAVVEHNADFIYVSFQWGVDQVAIGFDYHVLPVMYISLMAT